MTTSASKRLHILKNNHDHLIASTLVSAIMLLRAQDKVIISRCDMAAQS